jgi:hypothetical protein
LSDAHLAVREFTRTNANIDRIVQLM